MCLLIITNNKNTSKYIIHLCNVLCFQQLFLVSLNNYICIKENDHHKNQYVKIFALKININLFLFLCNNENSEKKFITFILQVCLVQWNLCWDNFVINNEIEIIWKLELFPISGLFKIKYCVVFIMKLFSIWYH